MKEMNTKHCLFLGCQTINCLSRRNVFGLHIRLVLIDCMWLMGLHSVFHMKVMRKKKVKIEFCYLVFPTDGYTSKANLCSAFQVILY